MNKNTFLFSFLLLFCMYSFSCKKENSRPEKPTAPTAAAVKTEIVSIFKGIDSLSNFAAKFNELQLSDEEVAAGLTVFAISNKSFTDKTATIHSSNHKVLMYIGAKSVNSQANPDPFPDDSDIKDYIIKGKINLNELKDGQILNALSGKQLTVSIEEDILYLNEVKVNSKGIHGTNVRLFTIDASINYNNLMKITGFSETGTFPGWLLTIYGRNFSAVAFENTVQIDGKPALVHIASEDSLVVTVPADVTGGSSVNVTVTKNNKSATKDQALTVMQAKISTIDPVSSLKCRNIQGITIDADDNIFFTDPTNNRVIGFNPYKSGGLDFHFYRPLIQTKIDLNGDGKVDSQDRTYTFVNNWAITSDPTGDLYISSIYGTGGKNGGAIYKMTLNESLEMTSLQLWAGGNPQGTILEGPKETLSFLKPTIMLFDYVGTLLFNQNVMGTDYALERISGTGLVTKYLGNIDFKSVNMNIDKEVVINGLVSDKSGPLYISDVANARIWKYASSKLQILAGNGIPSALDGVREEAQVGSPFGMILDDKGNLYVCDNDYAHESFLIRVINPFGVVTTIAGAKNSGGPSKDGIGLDARFYGINAIARDSKGVMYIGTDEGTIRQLKIE